jgi:hypothetical protein
MYPSQKPASSCRCHALGHDGLSGVSTSSQLALGIAGFVALVWFLKSKSKRR